MIKGYNVYIFKSKSVRLLKKNAMKLNKAVILVLGTRNLKLKDCKQPKWQNYSVSYTRIH